MNRSMGQPISLYSILMKQNYCVYHIYIYIVIYIYTHTHQMNVHCDAFDDLFVDLYYIIFLC